MSADPKSLIPTSPGGTVEQIISEDENEEPDADELILDSEPEDFTTNMGNMQGAPYHDKVEDYIKNTNVDIPKQVKYISNLSSTKTGFKTKLILKDFEFKKENLMEIL